MNEHDYWLHEVPWVSPKDMKQRRVGTAQMWISSSAVDDGKTGYVPPDSLLLVVRSGILRRQIPVAITDRDVAFNQDIKGYSFYPSRISAHYVAELIASNQHRLLPLWSKQGATVESLEQRWIDDTVVCVPPMHEQQIIVDFLDVADARISRFIATKRRMIALLEEQKQAIITQAVTRGLDPDVPLKPSGVDWLGDIPAHWEVVPFTRYVVDRSDYRGATPEKVESGVILVTARNVRMGWIDYESSKEYVRLDQYDQIMRRGFPRIGDLLLTMEAPLGNVALVDRDDVAFAQRIVRFRMDYDRFDPQYVLYATMANYFQSQLQLRATGSTASGIKASKLPQLFIVCPPRNEQRTIVEHLLLEISVTDQAISRAKREIELIQEYRTRLISDVVTGKLDVRGLVL